MAEEAQEVTQEEEAKASELEAVEEAEQKAQQEAEAQAEEDEQRDPGSSMVASWGFNAEAELLEVTFQNGREETYSCTPEQWAEANSSPSAGKWMHQNML